jgi:murein DD-endopeptidase MepM/ murein hydrolase activator NlpD
MAAAWYDDPINAGNKYQTSYLGPGTDTPHYAYDIETPFHTPLTAPLAGTVEKSDYQAWGGEIFIKPDNSAYPEYYFYHPDELLVQTGQHINAGQEVALSGGENPGYPGGQHPADPQYSSGPHTHLGWFTQWVTPPQTGETIPYGPDPANLLAMASGTGTGSAGFQVPSSIYTAVHPIAASDNVPDALWETVASVESSFNSQAVGDNGTSYGLFQLHQGGQLGNLSESQAFDPTTNANTAMPAIASAWATLGPSFAANNLSWWEQFAAASGHPGGAPGQAVTDSEAQKLMTAYNNAGANMSTSSTATLAFNPLDPNSWASIFNPTTWVNALLAPVEQQAGGFFLRLGVGAAGIALIILGGIDIIDALQSPGNGRSGGGHRRRQAPAPAQPKPSAASTAKKVAEVAVLA